MPLKIVKMNLFDAPVASLLTHGTNCFGVWGAGIAKVFKEQFPVSYMQYYHWCRLNGDALLGTSLVIKDGKFQIGCLFTSVGFGASVDLPEKILESTKKSLNHLLKNNTNLNIYSNKFNSGLFNVPWEHTEKILKDELDNYPNINWTVCDWP